MSGVVDAPDNPISDHALAASATKLSKLFKRVAKRAPAEIRERVEGALSDADAVAGSELPVDERLELAKRLEDLSSLLKGREPWVATFYRDGRLAIVRAQDPIKIQTSVDHIRLEQFFERYLRRVESAFERLSYFLERAGVLSPEEDKTPRPVWDQPYISFDQYRELLWGRIKKNAPRVRRE